MPFPAPPWHLEGSMWLTLFRVGAGTPGRPPGLYGAGFAAYGGAGVLSYRELLVARWLSPTGGGAPALLSGPRVRISDIWVDSEVSRDGGRALWAIPKDLADLHLDRRGVGPAGVASWSAARAGSPVAAARFWELRAPAPPLPFRLRVSQPWDQAAGGSGAGTGGAPAGERLVESAVTGSGAWLPAVGRWDVAADGPLGWLRGRTPLLSVRCPRFRLSFGG